MRKPESNQPPEISPDARNRIDSFCKRIAVARDFDDDIREELASHMTEKLAGYLSGARG